MHIVFDVGRVLIDANMDWETITKASGLAHARNPLGNQPLYGMPEYEPYESGQLSSDDYLSAMMNRFGLNSLDEAEQLHGAILGPEFEGVVELIESLNASGIPVATLSNNNPLHWKRITQTGPYPGVQSIPNLLCSFELGAAKPDLAIYRALETQLGWKADEILFFDDSAKYIEGARSAGWRAIQITTDRPSVLQLREHLTALGVLGSS